MRAITNAVSILLIAAGNILLPGTSLAWQSGTWSDGPAAQVLIEDQELIGLRLEFPEPGGEDSIFVSHPVIDRYGRVFYGKSTIVERLELEGYVYLEQDKNYLKYYHFHFKFLEPSLWQFETQGQILSSPSMSDNGALFFGCNDSSLYSITLYGELNWSYKTGAAVVSSPMIGEDGTIYVGSKDRYLYAILPNGTLQWSRKTGGEIVSSPALADNGTIYIGSRDGLLYAFSSQGDLLWSYSTGGQINSSPAVGVDGTLYFGSNDSSLYALNSDGSLKWRYETGGEVISSPAIDFEGTVCFGSGDRFFYALNPDGSLKWSYQAEQKIWACPVIDFDGRIIVGTNNLAGRDDPQADTSMVQEMIAIDQQGSGMPARASSTRFDPNSYAVAPNGWHYSIGYRTFFRDFYSLELDRYGLEQSPWPRFRHDYRNTGNVNTAVSPPRTACDFSGNGILSIADVVSYLLKMERPFQGDTLNTMIWKHRLEIELVIIRQLVKDIWSGGCLESGPALASWFEREGLVESMSLSPDEVEFLEETFTRLNLTPEVDTALRIALHGTADPARAPGLPRAFTLEQNFPNPFNPATTISYTVPVGGRVKVTLKVYSLRGQLIRTLVDIPKPAGSYTIFWDGTDEQGRKAPSGVYLYCIKAGDFSQTRKMVLLK